MLQFKHNQDIKLLIADDNQIMIDGIKKLLLEKQNDYLIKEARNGEKAMEIIKNHKVDIAILNIAMQPINSLEIVEFIQKNNFSTKVLMMNIKDKKEYFSQLIHADIDGFISNENGIYDLLQAIETLIEGKKYYGKKYDTLKTKNYYFKDYTLTQREIEIIRLISRGDTSPEIGEKLFISKHTVLTHRKNILSKLNLKNGSQLVRYAINCGWG